MTVLGPLAFGFVLMTVLLAMFMADEVVKEWRIRHLVFLVFWPICLTFWGLREAVRFLNQVIRRGW